MFDFIISYFKKEEIHIDMVTFLFDKGNIFAWGRTDGYDELGRCKSVQLKLNDNSKKLIVELKNELIKSHIESNQGE